MVRPAALLIAAFISSTSYSLGFTQAGMNERAEFFNNLGEFLQWVTENVKPDRIDSVTDARFQSVRDEVRNLQKWSGLAGVALVVPVARSKIEPSYKLLMGEGTPHSWAW